MDARTVGSFALVALTTVFLHDLSAADPPQFVICFCTTEGHASVHLLDGTTGQQYGRGLYDYNYSNKKNAPAIPFASDPASGGKTTPVPPDASTQGLDSVAMETYGVIQDDNGMVGKKCICYELSMGEYNEAVKFINTYEPRYNVATQNCVSFVFDTAEKLGKWLPELSVPEPSQLYWLINSIIKILKAYPDGGKAHRQSKGYSFMGYVDQESQKNYFGKILKPAALGGQRRSYASLDRERERQPEDLLLSPDVIYRRLVERGVVPAQRHLVISGGSSGSCGADCFEVQAGAPITFSTRKALPPGSLAWWDFGDGYQARIQQPTHVFTEGGFHRVRLHAVDEQGSLYFGVTAILVQGAPLPSSAGLDVAAPPEGAGAAAIVPTPLSAVGGEAAPGSSLLLPSVMYPGGHIEGVVLATDDRPVAGAVVIAGLISGDETKIVSDRSGRFVFPVPAATGEVLFHLTGKAGERTPAMSVPSAGKSHPVSEPPASQPGPYVKPGDRVDLDQDLAKATLDTGDGVVEVPVAKAVSQDGHQTTSSFRIPANVKPGAVRWRLTETSGVERTGASRVYTILEAWIDDSKLRSHQVANFRYVLDLGPDMAQRKLCARVRITGPVDLVQMPPPAQVGTDGRCKVTGRARARKVPPGPPVPFSIQLALDNCEPTPKK